MRRIHINGMKLYDTKKNLKNRRLTVQIKKNKSPLNMLKNNSYSCKEKFFSPTSEFNKTRFEKIV